MADYQDEQVDRRSLSPRREEPLRDDTRDEDEESRNDRYNDEYSGHENGHEEKTSNGNEGKDSSSVKAPPDDDEDAKNEGTNLFVTGLARSVTEAELEDLFAKSGPVEKVQIMVDPHSRDSRGFGFVNMATVKGADAAMADLNGYSLENKTLAVEKAKRKRPRTPTPGKYFGPPKPKRGPPSRYDDRYRRDYGRPRYDDRYDDYYRRPRYEDRDRMYRDRSYSSRYEDRGPPSMHSGSERYRDRDYRDYRDNRNEGRYRRDDRYRDYGRPPRSPHGGRERGGPPPSRDYRDEQPPYRGDEGFVDRERDDYR